MREKEKKMLSVLLTSRMVEEERQREGSNVGWTAREAICSLHLKKCEQVATLNNREPTLTMRG